MKCLFLYDEFGAGLGYPSMKDSFESKPYEGQDMIVRYLLEEGKSRYAKSDMPVDKLTGKTISMNEEGLSDGTFSWLKSLAYYVKNYNLKLPSDFEDHVKKHYMMA